MAKEKRNNLAIYTLAGSILLSSVIVSMNSANSAPSDRDISILRLEIMNVSGSLANFKRCVNNNFSNISFGQTKFVSSCR
jgi:hypothetical protein